MARNKLVYKGHKGGIWGCQQCHQPPLGTGDSTVVPCPPPKPSCQAGAAHCGDRMLPWAGRPFDPGQSFPGQIKALPLELLKFLPPLRAPIPSVWESALPGAARLKIRFSPLLTQNVTKPGRKDGAGPGFGVLRAAIRELFGSSVEGATLIYLGCPEGWRMELCLCWGKMFSSADSLGSAVPRHTAQHILGVVRIFIQGFLTLSS